jgi:hypothetical protein
MASVKKVFQPLMTLLTANQSSKVSALMDQINELVSAKVGGGGGKATTFHRLADNTVAAVKCYYFQQWMDPRVVDFGAKAGSATGLNSMCKAGLSAWTKQQSVFKKAKEALLAEVAAGNVAPAEINDRIAELEQARDAIIEVPAEIQAFDSLEDCLNNSEVNGLSVA